MNARLMPNVTDLNFGASDLAGVLNVVLDPLNYAASFIGKAAPPELRKLNSA